MSLKDLTAESFREHLGSRFRVHVDDVGSMDVELVDVALHEPHAGPRSQPFSLLFRGHLKSYLPQAIYRLEHATLGTLELFLVPVGPDERGMRYEAIFN
jgi:uncharacterized protein DUF6916